MRADTLLACLASTILGAAPGLAGEPVTSSRGCRGLSFASTPRSRSLGGFSASRILDVTLSVELPRRPAGSPASPLEVRVFSPHGHLYQTTPVTPGPATDAGRSAPLLARRWQRVALPSFPVGGTPIVTSSLYGTWRVEVWPEGASPCTGSFVLRP
jgi:hypothetical protein